MLKGHLVAAVLAGGLLMAPAAQNAPSLPTGAQPAAAVPLAQIDVAKGDGVTLVKRGRGGGRGMRRGGGRKSFGGGGRRKFSGGGGRRKFYRGGGRRKFRGGPRRWHGKRHRRRSSVYYYGGAYLPYYYGGYGYSYDDDCEWLRRKALRTDSSYWWRRYDRCING